MFQEILTHLNQNKLRTALTGLSVSVGIFLLIFLLGAGNGLIHAFQANMGNFATNSVELYAGLTSQPYEGLPTDRWIALDDRDATQTQDALPHNIEKAAPQLSRFTQWSHNGRQSSGQLLGVYPVEEELSCLKLLAGRFINDIDLQHMCKSIVVTASIAEELYGSCKASIGQQLRVDSLIYTIVGVTSNQGNFGRKNAYIPFTTLRTAYNTGTEVRSITFKTKGLHTDSIYQSFASSVRRSVSHRHRFSPTDETAIWINNTADGAKEQNSTMNILTNALWVIGLLTLLSGVVSISNIMLITVKERTHEFGIRKALGARPWNILRSVMLESIIITLLSGYVGLVAGIIATEWMSQSSQGRIVEIADQKFYTFLDPTIDFRIAVSALIVLIVAGLIAGFFPARRAVKVKPIEALSAK